MPVKWAHYQALAAVLLFLWAVPAAAADDDVMEEKQPATMVRTSDGLNFAVPPDWPIERRNGAVGPIPIEEYLARKFGAVEKKLQDLERKLGALESKVSALETQAKKKPLQSSGPAAP